MFKNGFITKKIILITGGFFLLTGCAHLAPTQKSDNQISYSPDELFMMGQRMKLQQKPAHALAYFKEFSRLKPQSSTGYYEIAKQYNLLHQEDSVFLYAQKAAQSDSSNKWIQQFYAKSLANRKQYLKAATIFHHLGQENKNTLTFPIQETVMLTYAERYNEALDLLDSLQEGKGEKEELLLQRQWIFSRQNKLDSAEKVGKELLAIDPDNGEYYALLAQLYSNLEKPQKAIDLYLNLLTRQPDNLYAKLALGVLYKTMHQRGEFRYYLRKVFENKKVTIQDKIDFIRPFLKYVEIDTAEQSDAFWLGTLLTKVYPHQAGPYALLGDLFYNSHKKDSAALNYKKSIAIDPSKYGVWHQLLLIYSENENMDSLLHYSKKAILQFPKNPEARIYRGMAFFYLEKYEKTASILQEALKLKIKDNKVKRMIYRSLSATYLQLHQPHKAKKYKKKAEEMKVEKKLQFHSEL